MPKNAFIPKNIKYGLKTKKYFNSSYNPCAKMAIPDFQLYPQKLFLIKYEIDIISGFCAKMTGAFLVYKEQWRNSEK